LADLAWHEDEFSVNRIIVDLGPILGGACLPRPLRSAVWIYLPLMSYLLLGIHGDWFLNIPKSVAEFERRRKFQ
jgi:hypothetical protein